MFKKIKQFISEAIRELSRVSWPTRSVVLKMTIAVIVISALFGIFASVVDLGITTGLRELLVFKETRDATTNTSTPIQVNPEDIQVESNPAN
ncbi:MAG: preprotein translocase subunit SecE [Patescibacteria group bacterium]|jgi:preprotein translocase subunit SecE